MLLLPQLHAQLGKKKWRCELDGKEFSTMNIMRAHFEKNYTEQALAWFEEQVPSLLEFPVQKYKY